MGAAPNETGNGFDPTSSDLPESGSVIGGSSDISHEGADAVQEQDDPDAPGWHVDATGARYFMVDQGQRASRGWLKDGDDWYYINAEGTAQMGWLWWNRAWFYFIPSEGGRMATGVCEVDGVRYLLDQNGYMQVG